MEKVYVNTKEADGQTFYYVNIGRGFHYHPTYMMWVHRSLLKQDDQGQLYLEFPVANCDIRQGKKETTLILRRGNKILYNSLIKCGYRGNAYIEDISSSGDSDDITTFYYDYYESERGNLGISQGVLVLTRSPKIKIKWRKTGRLYGAPDSGITILYSNGKQEEIYLEDLEELEELKELEEKV